jgi:hypothetical protein
MSKLVKRKLEKWLTCINRGSPSLLFLSPIPIIPALLTKTSKRSSVSLISLAKARTDSNDAMSTSFTTTSSFPVSLIIFFLASSARFWLRHAKITLAPLLAKSRAVSNPIPEDAKLHQ